VLEHVRDLALNEKSLMVAVKNIARRLGNDIQKQSRSSIRAPDGSRVAAVIPPCSIHGVTLNDPQIQQPPFRYRRPRANGHFECRAFSQRSKAMLRIARTSSSVAEPGRGKNRSPRFTG